MQNINLFNGFMLFITDNIVVQNVVSWVCFCTRTPQKFCLTFGDNSQIKYGAINNPEKCNYQNFISPEKPLLTSSPAKPSQTPL